MSTNKGYIHVYTGNGKGKTTAAFGLALRSLCAGKRVYIGQFVKSMKYNETKIENLFDTIQIEQFGSGCFIQKEPAQVDIDMALDGFEKCQTVLTSGDYDLVILDEITIALFYKLFTTKDVVQLLENKHSKTEVVVTGRYAPQELIDMADVVTDMQEVKHYYSQGVEAREGIER